MNKFIFTSLIGTILLTGCVTKYKEVTKELPIFEDVVCVEPKKVKMPYTVIIGNDYDITITKGIVGDNALVVMPFTIERIDFNETMLLYPVSQIRQFVKCYKAEQAVSKKRKAVILDNNSKVKPD